MLEGKSLKEHTLNRLGYGPSGWHSIRYDELGFNGYVSEQLDETLPAMGRDGTDIKAKLDRSILERRQLEVVLLDFWFNHFNVDEAKTKKTIGHFQNKAIKPHILSQFGPMLLDTAKSPAMLAYLDNRINYAEREVDGKKIGVNENYAREVMELHTLGVDGGYAEQDVAEVARILTGWSIAKDRYEFKDYHHDEGAKTVMGISFAAEGGEAEGVELLAMLAAHPSTAKFIAFKLCQRFVNEAPPAPVVKAAADIFSSTDGDIKQVVRTILTSPEFASEASFRTKVKSPHRFLVSAVLAMGSSSDAHYSQVRKTLEDFVEVLGEEPYGVSPPTGYPEESGFWVSSSTMLSRFIVNQIIAYNPQQRDRLKVTAKVDGSSTEVTVDGAIAQICPGGVSNNTRTASIDYVNQVASTDDDRVSAAAQVILSSPEFLRF